MPRNLARLSCKTTFKNIYKELLTRGTLVHPRTLKVLEIENFNYVLPPYYRFINFAARKLNLNYIKREFQWYLRGDAHDLSITKHAKLWGDLVTKSGEINSNYGQYIFGQNNQFDYVVKTLQADQDSRRASIVILSRGHVLSGDKDLPCTYSMNFRIRKNKLNMTVRMRSQDAIYGMGSDVPCFSFIHEMVLSELQSIYPKLRYGDYYHSADSFHVYERHFEMVKQITKSDSFKPIHCPKIGGKAEVDFLRAGKFQTIPPQFAFTRWLTQIDQQGVQNWINNVIYKCMTIKVVEAFPMTGPKNKPYLVVRDESGQTYSTWDPVDFPILMEALKNQGEVEADCKTLPKYRNISNVKKLWKDALFGSTHQLVLNCMKFRTKYARKRSALSRLTNSLKFCVNFM